MDDDEARLDDEYNYTDEEKRRLTLQLADVIGEVYLGQYSTAEIGVELLCTIHRRIFDGVRDHAGRPRSPNWGREALLFGPNRSTHRRDVPRELAAVFKELAVCLRSLAENPLADGFERDAIHIAVWAHASVIKIHPFIDGNGRSSRALMAVILNRCGMPDLPIEAVKDEYTEALNHFFPSGDLQPLVDLYLRIAWSVMLA